MSKTKLYFIRHGQSKGNAAGIISGHDDHELNEKGHRDAENAALKVPTNIEAIYSSDLTRCKQTAEIINAHIHVPLTIDPRFKERHFGSLTGKAWEEFDQDHAIRNKDADQEYDYRPYGGESVDEVSIRLHAALDDIKEAHQNASVLIVTSGGIIRLMHYLYGSKEREIMNGSLHEFTL